MKYFSGYQTIILSVFFIYSIHSVHAQIPHGYYKPAENLSGENLKFALYEIIKEHKSFPYTAEGVDVWDILKETDKDPKNSENVILLYSGWSVNANQEYNNGNGWTREQVWARSHGDFGTSKGPGTDVHHIRPVDPSVNSARNNKDFDRGGTLYMDGDGPTQCYSDVYSWEPREAVKGDIARMLFYMAIRYEGENGEPDLELVDEVNSAQLNEPGKGFHGRLSVLLDWHKTDPVDSFEINRNEIIYSFQQNRNPFIDHPEYVDMIWKITSLKEVSENPFKIFPVPARKYIYIQGNSNQNAEVFIYSPLGTPIANIEVSGVAVFPVENLSPGIYFMKLTVQGSVFFEKIVVAES